MEHEDEPPRIPAKDKRRMQVTALPIGNLLALFEANIAKSDELLRMNRRDEAIRAAREERKACRNKAKAETQRYRRKVEDERHQQGRQTDAKAAPIEKERKMEQKSSVVREKVRLFERRPKARGKKKTASDETDSDEASNKLSSSTHSIKHSRRKIAEEWQSKASRLPADSSSNGLPESTPKGKRRRTVMQHAPHLSAERDWKISQEGLLLPLPATVSTEATHRVRKKSVISLEDSSEHSKPSVSHRKRKKKKSASKRKGATENSTDKQKKRTFTLSSPHGDEHNGALTAPKSPVGQQEEYLQKKGAKKKNWREGSCDNRLLSPDDDTLAVSIDSRDSSVELEPISRTKEHDGPSPPAWTPTGKVKVPEYPKQSDTMQRSQKQSAKGKHSREESESARLQSEGITISVRGDDEPSPPAWTPTGRVNLPDYLRKKNTGKETPFLSKSDDNMPETKPTKENKGGVAVGKIAVPETFKKGQGLPGVSKHRIGRPNQATASHQCRRAISHLNDPSKSQIEEQSLSDSSESTSVGKSDYREEERRKITVPEQFRGTKTPNARESNLPATKSKLSSKKTKTHLSRSGTCVSLGVSEPAEIMDEASPPQVSLLSWDRSANNAKGGNPVTGPVLQRRRSLPNMYHPSFVRPVTYERKMTRRASTGRLRIEDIRDGRHWEVNATHAIQITPVEDARSSKPRGAESRARAAPPRRMIRRHSTGSVSARSNESDDTLVDFWHTYESDDSQPPQKPMKNCFSRRRAVRFDSNVTVWIFTKEDTPFECDLQLPQSFVPSMSSLDTAPKPPRRTDTAPKVPIRRRNSGDEKAMATSVRFDSSLCRLSSSEPSKPFRKPSADTLVDMVLPELGSENLRDEEDAASVDTWTPEEDRPLRKVKFAEQSEVRYYEKWIVPEVILPRPGIVFCATNSDCAPRAPRRLDMMDNINESFLRLCNYETKGQKSRQVDLMPCKPRRRCSLSSHTDGDDCASATEGGRGVLSFSAETETSDKCPPLIPIYGHHKPESHGCICPRDVLIGPTRWDSSDSLHLEGASAIARSMKHGPRAATLPSGAKKAADGSPECVKIGPSRWDSSDALEVGGNIGEDRYTDPCLRNNSEWYDDLDRSLSLTRAERYGSDSGLSIGASVIEDRQAWTSTSAVALQSSSESPLKRVSTQHDSDINVRDVRATENSQNPEKEDTQALSTHTDNEIARDVASRGPGKQRWDFVRAFLTEGTETAISRPNDLSATSSPWSFTRDSPSSRHGTERWDSTCSLEPDNDALSSVHSSRSDDRPSGRGLLVRTFTKQDKAFEEDRSGDLTPGHGASGGTVHTGLFGTQRWDSTRRLTTRDSFLPNVPVEESLDPLQRTQSKFDGSSRSLITNETILEIEGGSDRSEDDGTCRDHLKLSALVRPVASQRSFLQKHHTPCDSTGSRTTSDTIPEEEDESERSLILDANMQVQNPTAPMVPFPVFAVRSKRSTGGSTRGFVRAERGDLSGCLIADEVILEGSSHHCGAQSFLGHHRSEQNGSRDVWLDRSDTMNGFMTTAKTQCEDKWPNGSSTSSLGPRTWRAAAEPWDSNSSFTTDDLPDVSSSVRDHSFRGLIGANRYDSTRSLTTDDIPDDTTIKGAMIDLNESSNSITVGDIMNSEDLNRRFVRDESIIENMPYPEKLGAFRLSRTLSCESDHHNYRLSHPVYAMRPGKWRGDSLRSLTSRDNSDRSLTGLNNSDISLMSRQGSGRHMVGRNNSGRRFVDRDSSSEGLVSRRNSGSSSIVRQQRSGKSLVGGSSHVSRDGFNRSRFSDSGDRSHRVRLQSRRVPSFAKRPSTWRGDSIQDLAAMNDSTVDGGGSNRAGHDGRSRAMPVPL